MNSVRRPSTWPRLERGATRRRPLRRLATLATAVGGVAVLLLAAAGDTVERAAARRALLGGYSDQAVREFLLRAAALRLPRGVGLAQVDVLWPTPLRAAFVRDEPDRAYEWVGWAEVYRAATPADWFQWDFFSPTLKWAGSVSGRASPPSDRVIPRSYPFPCTLSGTLQDRDGDGRPEVIIQWSFTLPDNREAYRFAFLSIGRVRHELHWACDVFDDDFRLGEVSISREAAGSELRLSLRARDGRERILSFVYDADKRAYSSPARGLNAFSGVRVRTAPGSVVFGADRPLNDVLNEVLPPLKPVTPTNDGR